MKERELTRQHQGEARGLQGKSISGNAPNKNLECSRNWRKTKSVLAWSVSLSEGGTRVCFWSIEQGAMVMAQQVRVLAAQPFDPSSVLRTHMWKEKINALKLLKDPKYMSTCAHTKKNSCEKLYMATRTYIFLYYTDGNQFWQKCPLLALRKQAVYWAIQGQEVRVVLS